MSADAIRRGMASVFQAGDQAAWLVAETPSEVLHAMDDAYTTAYEKGIKDTSLIFVKLTLANPPKDDGRGWNGRTAHIRLDSIVAVSPPLDINASIRPDEEG